MTTYKLFCFGHRGACGHEPENTIRSVRKALALGADGVEVDVYFVDGQLVVIHDDTLERTTNGRGRVAGKTFACLRSLDAGLGEKIPTLAEIFDAVNRRAVINVELKGPHTATPVVALITGYVNRHGWRFDDFLVSSFDHAQLREAKQLCPEIRIGALIEKVPRAARPRAVRRRFGRMVAARQQTLRDTQAGGGHAPARAEDFCFHGQFTERHRLDASVGRGRSLQRLSGKDMPLMKNYFNGSSVFLSAYAACSAWSLIAAFLLLLDCPSVFARPVPAAWQPAPMKHPPAGTNAVPARWHTIVVTPRPGLPKIHFYDKLNPVWWFGNIDDPVPPDWYRPEAKHRQWLWRCRNPFHNFDFYVIGIADKKSVRRGWYPDKTTNPNGGWNFAVSRRRIVLLPYFSYQRGRFEFYFCWQKHGNFGIKTNFSDSNKPHDSKPVTDKP